MMPGWSMGFDAWLWMGVWVVVLAVLVAVLVREPRRAYRDDALEILKARFARGEISPDEFERATALMKP